MPLLCTALIIVTQHCLCFYIVSTIWNFWICHLLLHPCTSPIGPNKSLFGPGIYAEQLYNNNFSWLGPQLSMQTFRGCLWCCGLLVAPLQYTIWGAVHTKCASASSLALDTRFGCCAIYIQCIEQHLTLSISIAKYCSAVFMTTLSWK